MSRSEETVTDRRANTASELCVTEMIRQGEICVPVPYLAKRHSPLIKKGIDESTPHINIEFCRWYHQLIRFSEKTEVNKELVKALNGLHTTKSRTRVISFSTSVGAF
jgi:hypothetical protein